MEYHITINNKEKRKYHYILKINNDIDYDITSIRKYLLENKFYLDVSDVDFIDTFTNVKDLNEPVIKKVLEDMINTSKAYYNDKNRNPFWGISDITFLGYFL